MRTSLLLAALLPILDKVSVTAPSASLQSTVRGSAQAVSGSAHVIGVNMHSGHYAVVQASGDGSFEFPIYAAPGDSILIKSDPEGQQAQYILDGPEVADGAMSNLVSLHGTVVRAPDGLTSPHAFVDSGTSRDFLPYWTMQGSVDRLSAAPGGTIAVDATYSVQAAASGTPNVFVTATLIALSRADGSGALDQNTYCSTLMTPTGLPIERAAFSTSPRLTSLTAPLEPIEGGRLRASIRLTLPIPADLPAGYYRPILLFHMNGVPGGKPQSGRVTTFLGNAQRRSNGAAYLPIVKIGDPAPPRMYWTLLANTLVEGLRGANAVEDRDRFGIVPRITTTSDRFIVPRVDRRTGAALRYNLEPYALTLGLADRGAPINPPMVPLRFPSGGLTVTVRRPDGATSTIGPVPFRQIALAGPARSNGFTLENGGHITDPVRLTTLDPRFDVTFEQEGRHAITLDGTVEDVWGTVWNGHGTYEIDVAAPLLIESATIPGTPFETGNVLARGVRVVPPVPADIEIRVRFAPDSKRESMSEDTIHVRANRFGHAAIQPTRLDRAGEYRVDIFASYRDASGKLWAGTQTFGSVVAPRSSPMIANGKRGIDDQQGERQQWFSRTQLGHPPGRGHVNFAFRSGDVMWMQDDDATIPVLTVQDLDGSLAPVLRPLFPPGAFDAVSATGEIPLQSFGRKYDVHIDPTAVDLWSYGYRSVQRPHVRVREEIVDHDAPAPYWRFNDHYALQSGNGERGDHPNDFKFQFGGAVMRGPALSTPRYAIYGSLFVLVPSDDPGGGTRTFPPFQGNGGGPDGGPLFTLKNRDIDLFFHPTSLRAGSIVHAGEIVSLAGYSAPPLPSKIEIVVTSPSGKTRTIRGQANAVGWFYDPSQDFAAGETGVWRARVKITFDGRTSAGQVSEPFPTHEETFAFYVVDASSEPLGLTHGSMTFTAIPPSGLTNLELHYTTMMPGFVLQEGSTTGLSYTYDLNTLARDFPNLEAVDLITISLVLSGTDGSGKRRHFARQIVLNGDELLMPEQRPSVRRRAAR